MGNPGPEAADAPVRNNKQWPQWLAVVTASFNFFAAGICFCWSSPSLSILEHEQKPFPVTPDEASWIAAFLPIGCAVGPVLGAYLSRRLGPKQSTIISAFPYLGGFALIAFATGPRWLYVSRFLSGIGVGFGQTATPIYVAEIAENHNRGALMSFFMLWMAMGALFVSCVGPYVSLATMAGISSVFPTLLLLTLVWMPDSPYYLTRVGKEQRAVESLRWLRRQKNSAIIEEEMKTVRKVASENVGFAESIRCFRDRPNPRALLIVNATFFAQQICGAVVVLFYQEQLYELANVPIKAEVGVIISSVVGNLFGLLSMLFVDRWGRRPLLLCSALGCALSTGTLGTYFFLDERGLLGQSGVNWTPIFALNALQVSFSFGLSPVPSTQLGELFSSNVKEVAFCALSVMAALEGFAITKCFQIVKDAYGLPTVFWGLAAFTIVMMLAIYLLVPETKGKSFLEIQNMLCVSSECIPSDVKDIKLQSIAQF